MICLNDYLYRGSTVLRILHDYEADLRRDAARTGSQVDLIHCDFLHQVTGMLEHNDFLTLQSKRIREFYRMMTQQYPNLAFTFKGRIKSLIRAEGKFNGYITEYIADYYAANGCLPEADSIRRRVGTFRDLIAYRIVISLPRCNLEPGQDLRTEELAYLYRIAEQLPGFLEERGFRPELSGREEDPTSPLSPAVRPYYRDYAASPKPLGYRSLHITFFDTVAGCPIELQLRTKEMDDHASIGPANHQGYEKRQAAERLRREAVPEGLCQAFDEAWQRLDLLRNLDYSALDVNMFSALSEDMMNDGCGLYRGRLITPFEHLSKYQSDFSD